MFPILLIILGLTAYFLPWIIARGRGASNAGYIALLNLLLGWTVLGWIATFIWAVLDRQPEKPYIPQGYPEMVPEPIRPKSTPTRIQYVHHGL